VEGGDHFMSSIDERVVEAKFDNRQFQEGVKGTLNSLDSLKKGLQLEGAASGLNGLAGAATKVTHGINVMRIAAITAISTIAHQATIAGERFVKSFTVGPLLDGLHEYETQLNSVQTILSNTQWQKTTLKDVNGALQELNIYSDKTIYNFAQMARNVGTFTAAGVKLDVSVNAIKGIANLAAVSGSSADQASTAMYQLSQALASGTVKLMDWNSVVNAGMGGKVFQDALKETAKVHGTNVDAMIKKEGSFRNTLQKGWLTSKILTETLSKFTGDMSREQLKQKGYTEKQIDDIIKLGKTATDAATKIKTGTQLISTLKEAAGSGWAQTWQLIIGNFGQAKRLWTGVYEVIGTAITNSANARNALLKDWAKAGGRIAMLEAFKNAFKDFIAILNPIRDAFREIFPRTTGKQLADWTKAVRDFFERIKIGADTADNLRHTFAGIFALFDIGWQIIKTVAHFLADLFGTATEGAGGILKVTGNLGDFIVALDKSMKKGEGLKKFFDGLEKSLKPVIEFLRSTVVHLGKFAGFLGQQLGHLLDMVPNIFPMIANVLGQVVSKIQGFFSSMFEGIQFDKVLQILNAGLFAGILLLIRKFINHFTNKGPSPIQGFIDKITAPFTQLTETLKSMQRTLQAATLVEIALAVGVLTASVFTLSKINAADLTKALTAITVMFGQLFASLAVFNKIGGAKGLASTSAGLILFGIALRVLTSSVKSLAELSWQELAKGLVGVTVLLGALVLASKGMGENAGGMIRAGAGLLLLAAGIKVLASALKDLSGLSWGEMAKGLVGVGALLGSLALFTKFVTAGKAGVLQGAGLVLLATGIKILASAVGDFAKMSWGEIAKGLVTIGAILAGFAIFSKSLGNPVKMIASAAALLAISIAMNVLAGAMKLFGMLHWGEIAKGLVSMAGALTLIVLALNAMPLTSLLSAGALVLVSVALIAIAGAMKIMGSMSWGEIAKGLVTLAGALLIIAVAMDAMTTAVFGAFALKIIAKALALLVPELVILGALSWMSILKGLTALAGVFAVIGIAGALLTPVIPTLFGLAGSIALLGVGIAAIGAGVYLFATGLTILSVSGAAAAGAIKLLVESVVGLLPVIAKAIADTVVTLARELAEAVPQLVKTAIVLIDGILVAIGIEGPKIIKTFVHLILVLVNKLADAVPKMARAALRMLIGILDAIADKAPRIVAEVVKLVVNIIHALAAGEPKIITAITDWIIAILRSISDNLDRIIKAGTAVVIHFIQGLGKASLEIADAAMKVVIDFINGLAAAIRLHTGELHDAGKNLAFAVADGMTFGLASKAGKVATAAKDVAKGALNAAKGFLGISSPSKEFEKVGKWVGEGFAKGIVGSRETVIESWKTTHELLRTALDNAKQDISDYQDKLKAAQKAHNPAQVKKFTLALAEAQKEYNASANALDLMNHHMKKQHDHLINLGKQYDVYTAKLDKANQKLADAKQIRDDYKTSVTDQYNVLPDISGDTSLTEYEKNLKMQIVDAQTFADVMAQLRKMHLDDKTYQELIGKGPEALPFAQQILAGGKAAIDELTQLDSQLTKQAKALGGAASTALYQAGVDSAQGLVDGLVRQRDAIAKEMRHIAHTLVVELKKELKIKSPSQVFDELGQFTGKGLALGLKKSVPHIQRATRDLGKNTIEAMKKSIADMNDHLATQTDFNPTITPVLDLSTVRKQAVGMHRVLSAGKLSVDTAYLNAISASAGYQANREAASAGDIPETPPAEVTFIQHNTSPRALSTAEIYRNTNNQLSRAKGALTKDVA
jgi:tape measure domain-containing protein